MPPGPCVASRQCSRFLSSFKHRGRRVGEQTPAGSQPGVTPAHARRSSALLQSPICSLGFSLAFPPLLPRSSPGSSGLNSLFPRGCSSPPVLLWLPGWRNGQGRWGRRLSPFLLHPSGGRRSILRPHRVYVRGVLRVDAVQSRSPGPGGRSLSGGNIYARINPGGGGTPLCRGTRRGSLARPVGQLARSPVPSPSRCRRCPAARRCLPGRSGQPSG